MHAVGCQLTGIHVFEDIDTVLRDQDLMHLEDAVITFLKRHGFQAPGVATHRDHTDLGKILRACDAKAGFGGHIALVIGVFTVEQI